MAAMKQLLTQEPIMATGDFQRCPSLDNSCTDQLRAMPTATPNAIASGRLKRRLSLDARLSAATTANRTGVKTISMAPKSRSTCCAIYEAPFPSDRSSGIRHAASAKTSRQTMPKRLQVRPLNARATAKPGDPNDGNSGDDACAVVTAWAPYPDQHSLAEARAGRYATNQAKRGANRARLGVEPGSGALVGRWRRRTTRDDVACRSV